MDSPTTPARARHRGWARAVGRNGMHRYDNLDHSLLTAMLSVDTIVSEESAA